MAPHICIPTSDAMKPLLPLPCAVNSAKTHQQQKGLSSLDFGQLTMTFYATHHKLLKFYVEAAQAGTVLGS